MDNIFILEEENIKAMKNSSAESALKFSRIWIYVICKHQILYTGGPRITRFQSARFSD